jgi:hypothetical protein
MTVCHVLGWSNMFHNTSTQLEQRMKCSYLKGFVKNENLVVLYFEKTFKYKICTFCIATMKFKCSVDIVPSEKKMAKELCNALFALAQKEKKYLKNCKVMDNFFAKNG